MAFLEQLLEYDQKVQSKSLAVVPIYQPGILSKLLGRRSETVEYRSYLTQAGLPVVLPEKIGYRRESSPGATRSGVLLDESTALQLQELHRNQKLNPSDFPLLNDGFEIYFTHLEIAQSLYGEPKYTAEQLVFHSHIFKQVIAENGYGLFDQLVFNVFHATDGSGQINQVSLRYELSDHFLINTGDRRFAELELVRGDNRQIKARLVFGGQDDLKYELKSGQVVAVRTEKMVSETIRSNKMVTDETATGQIGIDLDKFLRTVVESMICSDHNNARFHLHRLLNYGPSF